MNLLDLLREDNIELKSSSNDRWVASCPFHEGDRDPSFTVYPNESYFCFGCRAWGNPTKWLTDYRKLTAEEAFKILGTAFDYKRHAKVIKIKNIPRAYRFIYDTAETYHQFLLSYKGPLEYLHTRGLTDETIFKYKIGYTDGRVLRIENTFEYEVALHTGVLDEGRQDGSTAVWERLTHRLTIPNLVGKNQADFIMGRTVLHDKVKYLGIGGHKPIHGSWEVRSSPIWFVVEGHFDWLLLRQWGYPAVALGGTHTTKDNLTILKSKRIVIVPDNDQEGGKAALELQAKLPNSEILDYTKFGVKDIGELAQTTSGQSHFDEIVREKLPWLITSTSPIASTTYFPSSLNMIPLL